MRPSGQARIALLAVLQAGTVGAFDALAHAAGVPVVQARQTLGNLRREGVVAAKRDAQHCHVPQRARAVYSLAREPAFDSAFDALSFTRQVWR